MAAGDNVIGQPEILLGFPPGGGGTQRLTRLVGTHQGLKLMLDGGGLDPQAAAQIGYVDEVVAPDELLDHALALADRLGQRLKPAVAAVKRAAYIGGSRGLEEGLHVESAEFLSTLASPGAQAAMLAYMARTAETGSRGGSFAPRSWGAPPSTRSRRRPESCSPSSPVATRRWRPARRSACR